MAVRDSGVKIVAFPEVSESDSDNETSGSSSGEAFKRASAKRASVKGRTNLLTCPRAWYRHPVLRIIALWMVLFMDFYTYGEDPVQDSHVRGTSIGTGQIAGLLSWWYVPDVGHFFLKAFFCIACFVCAFFVGRFGCAKWLCAQKCRLGSFRSAGGTIICTVLALGPLSFMFDFCYNATLDPMAQKDYMIDSHSMYFFKTFLVLNSTRFCDLGKMWQGFSATLDLLSIFQITDSILQDQTYWPEFVPCVKRFYNEAFEGKVRLLTFWVGFPLCVGTSWYLVRCTGNDPGEITWSSPMVGGHGETGRCFLAAFILQLDLFCLFQDWDFPLFSEHHIPEEDRTKIAGTDSSEFSLPPCFKWCRRIKISQKWMQYGPLMGIIGADMAFVKSMYGYTPELYGQYKDPDSRIWTITDEAYLDDVYPLGFPNKSRLSEISWAYRRENLTNATNVTDLPNTALFYDVKADYVGLALALVVLIGFFIQLRCASTIAVNEEIKRWGDRPTFKSDGEGGDCCDAPSGSSDDDE